VFFYLGAKAHAANEKTMSGLGRKKIAKTFVPAVVKHKNITLSMAASARYAVQYRIKIINLKNTSAKTVLKSVNCAKQPDLVIIGITVSVPYAVKKEMNNMILNA